MTPITKYAHGAHWLLIFYHYSKNGNFFDNETAYKIDDEDRFSIIGMISPRFMYDNYYEYLLEYPQVPGYNQWKQKKHIAETEPEQTALDIEYKPVHESFTSGNFSGMSKSLAYKDTAFDGSPGIGGDNNYFWYAIGSFKTYKQFDNEFPGPYPVYGKGAVDTVFLWIRIPGIQPKSKNFLSFFRFALFIIIA